MQCEKCGSENTQRLQVAFEGGTQDISATSHTAGVGSLSGALGLSGSITKTSGTSQSVLAQKVAPPQKRPLKGAVITAIIGLLFLGGGIWASLFGLGLIAAGGYFAFTAIQFNSKEWPSQYQYWSESWLCHKCGHIYHQA
jgi:hypothetical protein